MSVTSFASGPATFPPPVLEALQHDISMWRSSGQSVLELPFTSRDFSEILDEAELALRSLLAIPASHRVLFLQGGAFTHFSLLPMNLAGQSGRADYIETGLWSRRAIAEASPWVDVRLAANGDGRSLPDPRSWRMDPTSAYCHYTSNETADGLQFHALPGAGPVPLVADMSADLLTRPLPVERFGLIYASGQKNLGAAGLTIIIVREDLLGKVRPGTPAPLDYTRQAKEACKVNTPPTFAVAVALRMLRWLIDAGGVGGAEERSLRKSAKLYAALDTDAFYSTPIAPAHRSRVNIRFHLPTPALEDAFISEAAANGLLYLGGHPSIGGVRANLYNGVPEASVDVLVAFMNDFRRRKG